MVVEEHVLLGVQITAAGVQSSRWPWLARQTCMFCTLGGHQRGGGGVLILTLRCRLENYILRRFPGLRVLAAELDQRWWWWWFLSTDSDCYRRLRYHGP